jgi:hypothetical protein
LNRGARLFLIPSIDIEPFVFDIRYFFTIRE